MQERGRSDRFEIVLGTRYLDVTYAGNVVIKNVLCLHKQSATRMVTS